MDYNMYTVIRDYLRWKNSYNPHADGKDRRNPRDAREVYACQIVS